MAESLTASQFSALKGRRIVAQGQRVSAPPWVGVIATLAPLTRSTVFSSGETPSWAGERGRGEWGLIVARLTEPRPPVSSSPTYG